MNEIVLAAARMAAKQLHEAKSDKGKTSIADIFDAFLEHIDEQAKRIAKLEGTQCYSGACSYAVNYEEDMTTCRIRIDKQRAALKKLGKEKRARGKALVEERKLRMQLDASRFGMGIPEEIAIARAREQLHREGKL